MNSSKANQPAQPLPPGRVAFLDGQNELPMLEITTPWSTAEIYLNGAHVTHFKKVNEPPLLFMSQCSRFGEGQPIRGGIPVIFPWFGQREGLPQHGFARLKTWEAKEVRQAPDGSVSVRLALPECPEACTLPSFALDYTVTVGETLTLELRTTNRSKDDVLSFENCLHTYFEVGDCTAISIQGLKGVTYLDKVANFTSLAEANDAIRIASEVDRVYQDTAASVEILDPRYGRRITVAKQGSASTVVWNPWIAKSQKMADFGNEEYERMVCVESGNVGKNEIKLEPGQTSVLTVRLSSERLPT